MKNRKILASFSVFTASLLLSSVPILTLSETNRGLIATESKMSQFGLVLAMLFMFIFVMMVVTRLKLIFNEFEQ